MKILFACCAAILLAFYPEHLVARTPMTPVTDSFPAVSARPPSPARPVFPSAFYVFAGSDLEATRRQGINYIDPLRYLNIAMGYRVWLGQNWQLGAELWYSSFATPRIGLVTVRHFEPEGARITATDTVSLLRMRGGVFTLSAIRKLPAGFSLHLGGQLGYYPLAMTEYSRSVISKVSRDAAYQRSWSYDYTPAPSWVRRYQPAVRIGVEKRFFENYILGFSVQQALSDLSIPGDTRNFPTNWLGYVGYRIDL